jgi:hypothetical protein
MGPNTILKSILKLVLKQLSYTLKNIYRAFMRLRR